MTTPFPFVSGAVLTAAQMNAITTLPINDQTASYTLVVGDVGKRVIMNVGSANTVTVNNSIFAAGDTIFIANKGAGVSTITAGAGVTINTAGSLALAQYASATLIALSASTFLSIADSTTAAWKTWTPTYAGLTVGNATVEARYIEIGNFGYAYVSITLGSTSSLSAVTAMTISNPSTMAFAGVGITTPIGQIELRDTGTNSFSGIVGYLSTTTVQPRYYSVSGSLISEATSVTSTGPFTWTTGDIIWAQWFYQKA